MICADPDIFDRIESNWKNSFFEGASVVERVSLSPSLSLSLLASALYSAMLDRLYY